MKDSALYDEEAGFPAPGGEEELFRASRAGHDFLQSILDHSQDCIRVLDMDATLLVMNRNGCRHLEIDNIADYLGKPWLPIWREGDRVRAEQALRDVREGKTASFTAFCPTMKGTPKWWRIFASPIFDANGKAYRILSVSQDVTEQVRSQTIIEGQKTALEKAVNGESLKDVLTVITQTMERQAITQTFVSILMVDEEKNCLREGAAPSLPESYNAAVDGLEIGDSRGSCGTAAYLGREVVVSDIENDPRWKDFAGFALSHGLRACWSIPILSSAGKVIGTFAIYYPQCTTPSDADREVARLLADTAAIVIERHINAVIRKDTEDRLRTSDRRFKNKIDTMAQMIWVTDPSGHHEYYNKRWYEFTGVAEGSTDGDGWSGMFHTEDQAKAWKLWSHSLATGDPYEIEYRLRRHDGIYCWVLGRALSIRDDQGKILKWVGSCTLIEDQKRLQAELEDARQKAEEASLAKTEFLANMSHEIRTPMNAVIGIANILASMPDDNAQKKQFVKTLQASANSLMELINDLLDISKIESRNFELEIMPFNFDDVLQQVVSIHTVRAEQRGLLFTCEKTPADRESWNFAGDPTRIKQVLVNLCSNAIKFTEKGFVRIDVSLQADENPAKDQIVIKVCDSGVGIAADKMDLIFQKFTQADASINRKFGGTGLGLAISRTLVESMGGRITVESKPEKGSVFTVCLPLERK